MGPLILALAGCAEDTPIEVDPGFHVIGVVPEDGATDVIDAQIPELRFSDPASEETCTVDTVRLDGVHDDGSVAFPIEVTLTAIDRGSKLQLAHDLALLPGWTYVLTVQGGADGCTDTQGNPIQAFASRFSVP